MFSLPFPTTKTPPTFYFSIILYCYVAEIPTLFQICFTVWHKIFVWSNFRGFFIDTRKLKLSMKWNESGCKLCNESDLPYFVYNNYGNTDSFFVTLKYRTWNPKKNLFPGVKFEIQTRKLVPLNSKNPMCAKFNSHENFIPHGITFKLRISYFRVFLFVETVNFFYVRVG